MVLPPILLPCLGPQSAAATLRLCYGIATHTSALLPAELGPQSAAATLRLPSSEGSSKGGMAWDCHPYFCAVAGGALPSELGTRPTAAALWPLSSEGSAEVKVTILLLPSEEVTGSQTPPLPVPAPPKNQSYRLQC
ncbi:hypothetical protein UY3_06965 [Chelonia mydas]|uniref:Uncharacterized protein n=1 Tax=Chelonia mydas TaxID=8469 RepID=M7BD68_CHEMY|nr:hypothetical protein UY3_06965 [Chelonia mydas]